jgi:predicted O-methyltransferase YrrM
MSKVLMRIVPEHIQRYIKHLNPERDPLVLEMEHEAKNDGIPIMEPASIEIMLQLMQLHKSANILEIGTAIGYSAIRMAKALPHSRIYTIERDEKRYKRALHFIEAVEVQDRVFVCFGDALDVVEQVKAAAPFDVVFIDAAKGQYKRFFDVYTKMLAKDGMVITDNVLFRGLVTEEAANLGRLNKLAQKIDGYNRWLIEQPHYETVFYPIGDGIAVSRRKPS